MNPLAPNGGGRFNNTNVRTKTKRVATILLTGLLLIAGLGAWLVFQIARPPGSGPAGPTVSRELFSSSWTSHRVLFVGLGDSVTAGFGARKGYSYFDRLAKNPTDEFREMNGICLASVFPKFQFTNLAVSGSTSSEVPTRQLHSLPTNAPDVFGVMVVTTGGNDIIHNYGRTPPREEAMYGASLEEAKPWVENFGRRLDSTLEQINSRFPGGCEIFLANIFDPTDGIGDPQHAGLPQWKDSMAILDAYNAVIRHAADDVFERSRGGCSWRISWPRNSLHAVLARTFHGHDPHYWFYQYSEPKQKRYFLDDLPSTCDPMCGICGGRDGRGSLHCVMRTPPCRCQSRRRADPWRLLQVGGEAFGDLEPVCTSIPQWADFNLAVLAADVNFRRRADERESVQLQQKHVGRRVNVARGAVNIQRRRRDRRGKPLRADDLNDIAGGDVFLRGLDVGADFSFVWFDSNATGGISSGHVHRLGVRSAVQAAKRAARFRRRHFRRRQRGFRRRRERR